MHCIPTRELGFIIVPRFMLLFTRGIRSIGANPLRVFEGTCQLGLGFGFGFGFASAIIFEILKNTIL
jgi:hypothetical protein